MRISSRRVCMRSSVWFDSEGHVVNRIGGDRSDPPTFSVRSCFFREGEDHRPHTPKQRSIVVVVVVVVAVVYIYIHYFCILNISSRNRSQLLY